MSGRTSIYLAVLLTAVVVPLQADTIALSLVASNLAVYAPITAGWQFLANDAITISALGVYDYESNGFVSSPHPVGLWDDAGNLLASTTVSSSDTLIGGFRFSDIVDVSLTAGSHYRIGAQMLSDVTADARHAGGSITTDPRITYELDRFTYGAGLQFPTTPGLTKGYFGGNFLIADAPPTIVPEPSSLALLGIFTAAFLAGRMRRKT
jgi:hypothetical protein